MALMIMVLILMIKTIVYTTIVIMTMQYFVFINIVPSMHCHWDSMTCHTNRNY